VETGSVWNRRVRGTSASRRRVTLLVPSAEVISLCIAARRGGDPSADIKFLQLLAFCGKTKLLMYKAYASETWVLSKADERLFLEQCRVGVHEGRDITMNRISYLMSQILLNVRD
jgi:hypothetical protein